MIVNHAKGLAEVSVGSLSFISLNQDSRLGH